MPSGWSHYLLVAFLALGIVVALASGAYDSHRRRRRYVRKVR